jgi:hypothetical protein
LFPFGLIDILLEIRRTNTVAVNGMGILPEHQGHGGNALLYYAMGNTLLNFKQFTNVEMTQVAETTEQMRADLKNLNGVEYKNNRVYRNRNRVIANYAFSAFAVSNFIPSLIFCASPFSSLLSGRMMWN